MEIPALSPRQRAGSLSRTGIATERSKQHYTARLLCRNNELLHLSRAFAAWAAATRERRLQQHMNRCSTMLKHNTMRHDYGRFFLRWLAFTQARTAESYRTVIPLRKDVPLRSKADFLALARRYFAKWRSHLRETRQRTRTNVDLLAALNRERLRSRTLLRWWKFYHAQTSKRHELEVREHEDTIRRLQAEVRAAVNEAEELRDRLTAALQAQARLEDELDARREDFDGVQQQRQKEVNGLRESMRVVIEMVEGDDGPRTRALRKFGQPSPVRKSDPLTDATTTSYGGNSTSSARRSAESPGGVTPDPTQAPPHAVPSPMVESPKNSAQCSRETQAALLRSVEGAIAALADLSRSDAPPVTMDESIDCLRRRLAEDAEELACMKAQRDELAAAAKTAIRAMATATSTASPAAAAAAAASSLIETELDVSRAASVGSIRHGAASTSSAMRTALRADRSGMSASLPNASRRGVNMSSTTNPSAAAPMATAGGHTSINNNNNNNSSSSTAAAIINGSLPVVYLHSGTTTPSISLPASPTELSLAAEGQDLPRLLLTDAKNVVTTVIGLRKSEMLARDEVSNLQDAALRAIDALGGSGVSNEDFIAAPGESAEAREQRSSAIAMGLRNLCEDMIVVLVLTSLWSGERASERVSETLEKLWHRTQDLEASHADYLKQLDDLVKVVHVAVRMLRPPASASTASTPRNLTPRKSTTAAVAALARRRHSVTQDEGPLLPEELAEAQHSADGFATKGDAAPAELLRRCSDAVQKTATQSLVQTSELDGLLRSSQDLLTATVGAAGDKDGASASMSEVSSSVVQGAEQQNGAGPSPPEVVAALKAALRKIARVVGKVGAGSADTPLLSATQALLSQVEEQKKAHGEVEKRLRAAESQLTAAEAQRERDAAKHEAAEQKLRHQLEALGEQYKQNEATRKELEAALREAEKQAQLAEKAHKKQLDDEVKERKAVVKDLQQQLSAAEKQADQQMRTQQKLEDEIKSLRSRNGTVDENLKALHSELEAEKIAHAQTQHALEELEKQLHQQAQEQQKLAEEIGALHEEKTEAEKLAKVAAETHRKQLDEQATEHAAAVTDLEQHMDTLEEKMEARAQEHVKLQAEVQSLQEKNREAEEDLHELHATLEEEKTAHAQTLQDLEAAEKDIGQRAQEMTKLESDVVALQEKNKATEEKVNALREELAEEKAAHEKTQRDLDAQLRAAMESNEASDVVVARLQAEVRALQEEYHQAESENKKLEDGLQHEKDEHEQALRDWDEEREVVEREKQLMTEEMAKRTEERDAIAAENHRLTDEMAQLKSQLEEAAAHETNASSTQQQLESELRDMTRQHAESEAARRALEEELATAKATSEAEAAARAQLEQQLLFVEGENRVNNAVGIFLRDVLRDCLTRLHHLTRSVGEAEPLSPRASLTLQQARDSPPPLLTHDSDPSEYVEYILRLDGNDPTGKRLVQEHLRENAAVHGVAVADTAAVVVVGEEDSTAASAAARATPTPSSDPADPSTWEVVAELHDRLVLLYDRIAQLDQIAADQTTLNGELTHEKDQLCADALTTLQQLEPWSSAAVTAARTAARHQPSKPSSPTSPAALSDTQPEDAQGLNRESTIEAAVAGPALCASSDEVTQALEALQRVADATRPLVQLRAPLAGSPPSSRRASVVAGGRADGAAAAAADTAATERLQALVADIEDMASCLEHLSATVHHGIIALGGATEEEASSGLADATGAPHHHADHTLPGRSSGASAGGRGGASGTGTVKVDSHALAARLEAICEETGTSILEVRHLLLGEDPAAVPQTPSRPLKLGDVIPQIRAKMAELEEVKKESARLLHGLNRAFDDDEDSLFAASMSSTQSRSLRPKKKPFPAFQGTPEAGLRLLQQEMKGKKGRRTGAASVNSAGQLGSFGSHIRERLGDLQNLRLVCRTTLQVLEGRADAEEDGQPPTYGEALITLLTTQIEDLKVAIAESDDALKGYRRDLRNVTVGTRLHLLADVVTSLKLERDSLKEDINRRGRQSNMLLDDLNGEVKALRSELQSHQQVTAQLSTVKDGVAEELEAQKKNAAELAARLAQLQHESNVLSDALAKALQALPATEYNEQPPATVEKSVQAALKADHGDALLHAVEEALATTEQHQQLLHDTFRTSLAQLRGDLQQLRGYVSQCWTLFGAPLAEATAQAVTDTAEVLALENAMLRPRAVERESLKRDVAHLTSALADTEAGRERAIERLGQLDEENGQLRRALRDAEMANALNSTAASMPVARAPDSRMVDWERRMIAGATDLAMDAIDSMSGRSLAAVFGTVTEETLRIYKGVRESLRSLEAACAAARGTDGRRLWGEVEAQLRELNALADSADYLRTRLPVLYRNPYA